MRKNTQEINFTECPCTGKTLERLLRPAVLMVLAEGTLYGYKIVQRLAEMPMFEGGKPNSAGVYRCLKLMTEEKLIVSSWELSETGPAKRLYTLNEQGEHCLASWICTLHNYRQSIDGLLELGQSIIERWREKKDSGFGVQGSG